MRLANHPAVLGTRFFATQTSAITKSAAEGAELVAVDDKQSSVAGQY